MTGFAPKAYQSQVLESITAYLDSCHEQRSPSQAFAATTEQLWGRGLAYHPLSGFPSDMPYFCLHVPTGGGKTWLAAKSVALVNRQILRASTASFCAWCRASRSANKRCGPCAIAGIPTTLPCAKLARSRCWIWTKPRA